jgi:hypothetical protein
VRKLRALADKGSGLHAEGLAFQALQQRSAQLKAGLAQAYLKLRAVTASLPQAVEV